MSPKIEYQRLIENRGISLQGLGLNETALSRADAIHAVNLLRCASIPILGGDVYFKKVTGIESAIANSFSEPRKEESRDSFTTRSCHETESYIVRFPTTDVEPIFVLVIDNS